jgi:hypothetical protein
MSIDERYLFDFKSYTLAIVNLFNLKIFISIYRVSFEITFDLMMIKLKVNMIEMEIVQSS